MSRRRGEGEPRVSVRPSVPRASPPNQSVSWYASAARASAAGPLRQRWLLAGVAACVAGGVWFGASSGFSSLQRPDAPAAPADLAVEESWRESWKGGGLPPWHRRSAHPSLRRHLRSIVDGNDGSVVPSSGKLGAPDPLVQRVLVPLCGASVDVPFIASFLKDDDAAAADGSDVGPGDADGAQLARAEVVGIEAVAEAVARMPVDEPFRQVPPSARPAALRPVEAGFEQVLVSDDGVAIWVGNFFNVLDAPRPKPQVAFTGAWDRAALGAIEPSRRAAYLAVLDKLMHPTRGRVLMNALSHDIGQGPPHSLSESDIRAAAEPYFEVHRLSSALVTEQPDFSELRHRGATWIRESTYLLSRRSGSPDVQS